MNTATLHATIDVARRVERAEIEFCALAGSTAARLDVYDRAGGRALFSRAGSPLNKVLGLGLAGAVSTDDLQHIEDFFRARGVPTQIELCPLAYGDIAARLCTRGYVLEGFESELAMILRAADAADAAGLSAAGAELAHGVTVTRATADEDDLWTRIVSDGFIAFEPHVGGAPDVKPLAIEPMMEMMSQFVHPNIRRYLAWIDGEPAGGGAAWVYEGVLGIFGTSTLPQFRRRGVQAALTVQAMDDARGSADLAIATTAPGSTSQRTFERLGFRVLYTRAVFVKS